MAESSAAASGVNQGSQVFRNKGQIINNFNASSTSELTEVLQALKHHLENQTDAGNKAQKVARSSKKRPGKTEKLVEGPSAEEFMNFFQHERSLIPEDCEQLVRIQFDFKRLDHDRLLALIRDTKLQSWLLVESPAILLINGGSSSLPQSETSFFSSKLVESMRLTMQSNPSISVLSFFCGQHRDLTDVYSNPSELMMSLLLQLVEFCNRLSPAHLLASMSNLNPTEVVSICEAFEKLVETLDEDFRVFIIIDGLQFFAEPANRREKMLEVVKRLLGICKKPQGATMKLLLASPSRSAFVEDMLDDGEILNLPTHCRPAGVYGGTRLADLIPQK